MHTERLRLKKLNNTRDLGGFPTENGKKIKQGKLFRSGRFVKLPESTLKAIKKLGITTVVDFRSERERMDRPYTPIDGITYHPIPLLCFATTGITSEKSMRRTVFEDSKLVESDFGTADNYMIFVYKKMLFDDDSRETLGKFLRILIEADGGVLWFCNQGKDRTGIASMLVELILGVEEKLIIKDYEKSNRNLRTKHFFQRCGLSILPAKQHFKQVLYAMMQAKPEYIKGAIDEIKTRCGTVEEYCETMLGLTSEEIQTLKDKYLE